MGENKNITISYKEYQSANELGQDDRDLIEAANNAARNAYAPYSRFRVGSAIRLESGIIVIGTNVENAAFPSGLCAERSAISGMVSNYPHDKPVAMAISAMAGDGLTYEPVTPCGNCRQVIAEEESRSGIKIRILLSGKSKILVIDSIGDLLPLQFNSKNLRISLQ